MKYYAVNKTMQPFEQIKQPRGGYIKPKTFDTKILGDGAETLTSEENVHPILIGLVVDYMTRFMSGTTVTNTFRVSMFGAIFIREKTMTMKLMAGIKGLDNNSIRNALKLSGFDVCYRAGISAYKPVDQINPNIQTIQNVRTMVERSLHFLDVYGPKVLDGFIFQGGYTKTVSSGDGDFTTANTLWDFKVSKLPIKKEHTLQLLMYWRMGLHSIHSEFQNIKYLGIYNPRMNKVYRIAIKDIPENVIFEIDKNVIGYDRNNDKLK